MDAESDPENPGIRSDGISDNHCAGAMKGGSAPSQSESTLAFEKMAGLLEKAVCLLETATKTYIDSHQKVPFWRSKYLYSTLALAVALFGYWVNARDVNKQLEITEISKKIERKIEVEQRITEEEVRVRDVVFKQIANCYRNKHKTPMDLRVERLDALQGLIAWTGTAKRIFGNKAGEQLTKLISEIYHLNNDNCTLDPDAEDTKLHDISAGGAHSTMEVSIDKDREKIKSIQNQLF